MIWPKISDTVSFKHTKQLGRLLEIETEYETHYTKTKIGLTFLAHSVSNSVSIWRSCPVESRMALWWLYYQGVARQKNDADYWDMQSFSFFWQFEITNKHDLESWENEALLIRRKRYADEGKNLVLSIKLWAYSSTYLLVNSSANMK